MVVLTYAHNIDVSHMQMLFLSEFKLDHNAAKVERKILKAFGDYEKKKKES